MTNRSRPTRIGPAIRALLAILSLAYLGSGMLLSAQTIVGSGLNAQEGTQIAPNSNTLTGQYTDSLWADSGNQRWTMAFHGNTSSYLPVAAWPCVTQGCIVYAGTPQIGGSSGYFTETQLPFPVSGGLPVQGLPLLTANNIPQWGGGNGGTTVVAIDLQTGTKALALASEVPNDSTSGTSQYKLAKVASTGAITLVGTDHPRPPAISLWPDTAHFQRPPTLNWRLTAKQHVLWRLHSPRACAATTLSPLQVHPEPAQSRRTRAYRRFPLERGSLGRCLQTWRIQPVLTTLKCSCIRATDHSDQLRAYPPPHRRRFSPPPRRA
jgi:hypothetical protein